MGSLMAGWDSRVPDPKDVKLQRNKSLTKEEIDAYWRLKKHKEEEHLRDISDLSPKTQIKEAEKTYKRSISVPSTDTKGNILDMETESNVEKLIKKNGWWVSSNWAFLNEPPIIEGEGPKYKYASQFHVANMTSTSDPRSFNGISTQ